MSELRKDPIIGRWIIISTERARRPSEFSAFTEKIRSRKCPFCYGHENMTPPEILAYSSQDRNENDKGWELRVIPNKFPALHIEGTLNKQGEGMYDKINGIGAHEVIVESPDHNRQLHELGDKQVEDIIWAYRDRIVDLKRDSRLEYAMVLKNHGAAAGATLSHPHSQLIVTPIIPKRIKEEIRGAKRYFEYKERCVFCDIIRNEMDANKRIIIENDSFVALCPFASRFPFEIWIMPKKHESNFENIQRHEASSLSSVIKTVLKKMNAVLDNPPYNYIIHNSPMKDNNLSHYHWHIEIIPKLTKVAGFEWGTGLYINPTPPEEATKFLRESD